MKIRFHYNISRNSWFQILSDFRDSLGGYRVIYSKGFLFIFGPEDIDIFEEAKSMVFSEEFKI